MNPIKLVKLDCGKHFGLKGGKCSKCSYFNELQNSSKYKKYRKGLQYSGTPWVAILEEENG